MSRRVPTAGIRRAGGGRLAAANNLDELRGVSDELMQAETKVAVLRKKQQQLIHNAYVVHKTMPAEIGRAIGMSRQRVNQIIVKIRKKEAA